MPLASADPFGGVIITEWYSSEEKPGERFKANVFILDRELRSTGVQVVPSARSTRAAAGSMRTSPRKARRRWKTPSWRARAPLRYADLQDE